MMIPRRRRADLPAGHAWAIRDENGYPTVYINRQVPADSATEQCLVKEATHAWLERHRHRRTILPGLIAAPGAWLGHHAKLTAGASALAAAGTITTGAVIITPDNTPPAHPQVEAEAVAPPVDPTARIPPKRILHPSPLATTSDRPGHPSPPPDASDTPAVDHPGAGEGGGGPLVSVTVHPPQQPADHGPTSAPGPACKLIDIGLGRLVRVCV